MQRTKDFYVDIMALHQEVSGSCHYCVVRLPDDTKIKFLIDFGDFQEKKYLEYNSDIPFKASDLDFVAATHNHHDHIGRIQQLIKAGYYNKIYTSVFGKATISASLFDTKSVHNKKTTVKNRKNLYSNLECLMAVEKVVANEYYKERIVHPNVGLTLLDNGHIPGAASVLIRIFYPEREDICILFTGDYNKENAFFDIEKIPSYILNMNLTVIQESTYGKELSSEKEEVFEENIIRCLKENKTIIIPAYSQYRTQQIFLKIRKMQERFLIQKNVKVFLDGKLSTIHTRIYLKNSHMFKKDAREFVPYNTSYISQESRDNVLNNLSPKIIITSGGTGSHGSSPYYIENYISDPNSAIHFTGFPISGTISERLKNLEKGFDFKINGKIKKINCDLFYTKEFSTHARFDEIISFLDQFSNINLLLLNHGTNEAKSNICNEASEKLNIPEVLIESRNVYHRVDSNGLMKRLNSHFKI